MLIEKSKKPYEIGEELILPAAIEMSAIVLGKKEATEMQKISWSNNTVCRRIFEIRKINASNSFYELKKAENLPFNLMGRRTLQKWRIFWHMLDAFTTMTFTRICCFVNHCMVLLQGWMFFRQLMIFARKWVGMLSTDCVCVCTHGAAAMTRRTARFHARVRSASDTPITFTRCMIYREAIVAKKISPDLNTVVQDAVKVINFITSCALNTRILANLCDEMKSEFKTLLPHCKIRCMAFDTQSIKKAINVKK